MLHLSEPSCLLHWSNYQLFSCKGSYLYLCFLLLWSNPSLTAQNAQPFFRNYTTEHGLLSPEVHASVEGPQGYMWFATDNGLCRFDGYDFQTYGLAEGLVDPVILDLELDSRGRIWMATLSGKLFYLENDRIFPFVGNPTTSALRVTAQTFVEFVIDAQDVMYLNFAGLGIIIFQPDGQYELVQVQHSLDASFLYAVGTD